VEGFTQGEKVREIRILMPSLLAAFICIVTGIRSSLHKLRRWITIILAKQL